MKLEMTERQTDNVAEKQQNKELWITYHNSTESFFERIKGHGHSN